MKGAGLLLLLIFGLQTAWAQIVTEDASGQSSLRLKNSGISFNPGEAALSADWNNFRQLAIMKPLQTVWGLSARAASQEGLAELFSSGKLTPQSRLGGFIGLRRSNTGKTAALLRRINTLRENGGGQQNSEEISRLRGELSRIRTAVPARAVSLYLNAGMNASSFRLYRDQDDLSVGPRFPVKNFRGGFADAGINYDNGPRWTFGMAAGAGRWNNLDSLSLNTFTYSRTISSGEGQLQSETKYSAYQGDYIAYTRLTIKTDALYYASLNEQLRLVWNTLYTRFFFPLQEKRINKVIQAGTAVNFYKSSGQFAGGFYLQSNDVFNSMKGTDRFHERLSFGLVASYTFSTIISRDF